MLAEERDPGVALFQSGRSNGQSGGCVSALAKAPCLAAVMSVCSRGQHQADLVQADASSFHQASQVATQEASH